MTPARTLGLLLCGASAAVLVCGCKPGAQEASAADAPPPLAALPLADGAAPQTRPAPVAIDLPQARPARLGPLLDPGDGYAYLDRAYFLNEAFNEAPPDYGFAYADEEQPWVWRTDDGFVRIAEFLPYGVRYYYYEPGEDYPFLIRDPDYGYAYADSQLVAVYDSDDTLLPPEDLTLHAPIAGRELARAQAMFRGAGRDPQPVALSGWTSRRTQIASDLSRWRNLESHQSAWRKYHQEHLKPEQAHWSPERFRRAAETARIDRQIHDPDGADHALRTAREAQAIARRAHVAIPTVPRGRQRAGADSGQARMAMSAPGGPAATRASVASDGALRRDPPGERAWRGAQRFALAGGGPGERTLHDQRGQGGAHGGWARDAAQDQPKHLQIVQDRRAGGHGGGGFGARHAERGDGAGGPAFSLAAAGGGHDGGGGGHRGGDGGGHGQGGGFNFAGADPGASRRSNPGGGGGGHGGGGGGDHGGGHGNGGFNPGGGGGGGGGHGDAGGDDHRGGGDKHH